MTNAIELIRVSTEAQASNDRAGIPAQRAVNRATAARYGLNIVKTIELSDVSGASVLLAPEIQQLINLIAAPDIGAVVTREFSRLMRPEKFSDYALLQAFADSRTKLYLPEGPIDFSEKTGRLMGTIRAAIAGLERSEIHERCWRGKEEKRKQGKNVSAFLPFAVGYDKKRGWFYTEDAQRVRRAYEMVLSGETRFSEISKRTGIKEYSLPQMLRNPIYKGWRVHEWKADPTRRHVRADGRQGWCDKMRRAPEEVIRVKVIEEPLVSEEAFENAVRILDLRRAAHRRERGKGFTRYNGFLFCHLCGSPMLSQPMKTGNWYVCRNRRFPGKWGPKCEHGYLRAERIDEIIDHLLSREACSSEFVKTIADQLEAQNTDHRRAAQVSRLESELRSVESKRARIVDSYVDGVISRESRDERLHGLSTQLSQVSGELERLRASEVPTMTAEQIALMFAPFKEWEFLAREDQRRILAVTIPRIRVHNLSVVSFYRLLDGCDVALSNPAAAQPPSSRIKIAHS